MDPGTVVAIAIVAAAIAIVAIVAISLGSRLNMKASHNSFEMKINDKNKNTSETPTEGEV